MSQPESGSPGGAGQGDRLGALGQVAGELIHDMANLVAILDGRVRLARGDARAGRVPVGELERAADGCGDLGAMIRDVLSSLREEDVSPEVVMHPEPIVERAIRRALDGCRPVEIRLASSLPPGAAVRGRGSFLYRAVSNLLANAGRHALSQIRVGLALADGGRVAVTVEDDGPGVAAAERDAVFRPLVRGASGGTGLGLSSVAWTVAQLGGTVRCVSSPVLGGALFEILLPAATALPVPPVRPRNLAGKRVLVVDDNADVRRALGRYLRRMGADVVELGAGWETEEQLIHLAIRSVPDAVLLDLNLGVRSGVEVWALLRDHVPPLARRVVFLSGLGPGDAAYEEARKTGQRILPKPFDFDELSASLERVIREG
ncbi:MAG TPA: ATP-binding protein [Longimicrobiaceae bacterium]